MKVRRVPTALLGALAIGCLAAACGPGIDAVSRTSPPATKGATSSTTTTVATTRLTVGTATSFTKSGAPYYSVELVTVANPATPATSYATPTPPGGSFVGAEFTVTDTGSSAVTDDAYNDVKLYDTAGQGFQGDFQAPAEGPAFPSGQVDLTAGGTATGWVMFTLPAGAVANTITWTPDQGYAGHATATWGLIK